MPEFEIAREIDDEMRELAFPATAMLSAASDFPDVYFGPDTYRTPEWFIERERAMLAVLNG